jgi:hypothetical protein
MWALRRRSDIHSPKGTYGQEGGLTGCSLSSVGQLDWIRQIMGTTFTKAFSASVMPRCVPFPNLTNLEDAFHRGGYSDTGVGVDPETLRFSFNPLFIGAVIRTG